MPRVPHLHLPASPAAEPSPAGLGEAPGVAGRSDPAGIAGAHAPAEQSGLHTPAAQPVPLAEQLPVQHLAQEVEEEALPEPALQPEEPEPGLPEPLVAAAPGVAQQHEQAEHAAQLEAEQAELLARAVAAAAIQAVIAAEPLGPIPLVPAIPLLQPAARRSRDSMDGDRDKPGLPMFSGNPEDLVAFQEAAHNWIAAERLALLKRERQSVEPEVVRTFFQSCATRTKGAAVQQFIKDNWDEWATQHRAAARMPAGEQYWGQARTAAQTGAAPLLGLFEFVLDKLELKFKRTDQQAVRDVQRIQQVYGEAYLTYLDRAQRLIRLLPRDSLQPIQILNAVSAGIKSEAMREKLSKCMKGFQDRREQGQLSMAQVEDCVSKLLWEAHEHFATRRSMLQADDVEAADALNEKWLPGSSRINRRRRSSDGRGESANTVNSERREQGLQHGHQQYMQQHGHQPYGQQHGGQYAGGSQRERRSWDGGRGTPPRERYNDRYGDRERDHHGDRDRRSSQDWQPRPSLDDYGRPCMVGPIPPGTPPDAPNAPCPLHRNGFRDRGVWHQGPVPIRPGCPRHGAIHRGALSFGRQHARTTPGSVTQTGAGSAVAAAAAA